MGGKSKTSTEANQSTTETNTQTATNTSVGLEDVEFGVAAGGDLSFNQVQNTTDFGAVEAGIKAGQAGIDAAFDFGSEALDFGGDTVDRSLGTVDRTVEAGFDFGTRALDSVTASSAAASAKLGSAIDQVAAATRSDAANSVTTIAKYAAIGAVVIGIAVAAVFIFKK